MFSLSAGTSYSEHLVIPAYDEERVLALEQEPVPGKLVILVINEPPGAPSARSAALRERYAARKEVRILDLTGERSIKGGVGEARARGFELALERGKSPTATWIRTTDADATLPDDYWSEFDVSRDTAACLYPFGHEAPDPSLQPHVDAYEASLRYYVLGLAHAGSPFAFHTVGSTLAVRAHSYLQVHGFPKRQAGEDFYLLNKLAKVGAIERLDRGPLRLSGRASQRVPFGTGPSVVSSVARGTSPWRRQTYHPDTFRVLRAVIVELAEAVEQRVKDPEQIQAALRHGLQNACRSSTLVAAVLARLTSDGTLNTVARACRERNRGADRLRAVHTHFDAFRTLKLVHAMRDSALGTVSLEHALRCADHLTPPKSDTALHDICWLREAEQVLPSRLGLPALTGA